MAFINSLIIHDVLSVMGTGLLLMPISRGTSQLVRQATADLSKIWTVVTIRIILRDKWQLISHENIRISYLHSWGGVNAGCRSQNGIQLVHAWYRVNLDTRKPGYARARNLDTLKPGYEKLGYGTRKVTSTGYSLVHKISTSAT